MTGAWDCPVIYFSSQYFRDSSHSPQVREGTCLVQQKVGTEKSERSGDPSMSTHLVDHLIFLKLSNITKKSVCLCLSYVGKNITQNKVKFQSYACCRLEDKISIWLVVTTCIIWFLRQWLPLGHLAELMQSCWLQPYHGVIWEIKSKRGSLK